MRKETILPILPNPNSTSDVDHYHLFQTYFLSQVFIHPLKESHIILPKTCSQKINIKKQEPQKINIKKQESQKHIIKTFIQQPETSDKPVKLQSEDKPKLSKKKDKKPMYSRNDFKTPLTLFKNIMVQKVRPSLEKKKYIKQVSARRNLQTLPKLIAICQSYGILETVRNQWKKQAPKLTEKRQKKLSNVKFDLLQEWTLRTNNILFCENWTQGIQMYWRNSPNTEDKVKRCIQKIHQFRNTLNLKNRDLVKIQKSQQTKQ